MDKMIPNIGGKVYVDNNLDRFGQQILPRKPRDLVPGPGEYETMAHVEEPVITKGGFISQTMHQDIANNGNPGPAFYNAALEPKKISFLFNAAEKWTT